jgi:hypothetical protein
MLKIEKMVKSTRRILKFVFTCKFLHLLLRGRQLLKGAGRSDSSDRVEERRDEAGKGSKVAWVA